jgi:outer membrane protein insertion porin family
MRLLPVGMVLGLLLSLVRMATAQDDVRIDRVVITGNQRVEEEAIRAQVRAQPGTRLNEETVDNDIRAIHRMGFFDNVAAELSQQDGKWVLTYRVTERPLIREVHIEGNKKISREDLEGALKVRPKTIFDPEKVRRGIEEAKKLYEKKGYLDASITYTTEPVGENEMVLTYRIDEGKVVRITHLVFEGVRAFSARQLRNVMQTKQAWFLSFVTGAGNLDSDVLKTDIERLTAFYYDHGYIDVKIDEPVIKREKTGLTVTIKIDEGQQYKVGSVDISGDLLPDMAAARKRLSLAPGDVFRTSKLREDITALTEVYGDQGYAFVNVTPDTTVNPATKTVDVTYKVSKGPEVYIDKIDITGNTKTRDKVIRRELQVQEQQRFSGTKLRRSQERLRRLGFFEDINITTRRAESEDRLDLLVDVKEASTGTFSAGAGISSGETFLFNVRLSEINLFGRGQRLILNADVGSIRRNFTLDFTDPYLYDTQVTGRFTLFNWRLIYDQFTRSGTGGSVGALYPLTALGWGSLAGYSLEDTRAGMDYRIEDADISDVSPNAPAPIQVAQGTSLTSSVTPRLFRDTRNHPFDPTAGSLQDLSFQFAGLGGDSKFIKLDARGRWYFPVWKSPSLGTFVLSHGTTLGYGFSYSGDTSELPLFERYFPGGINSVRGFKILSLGPRTTVTDTYGLNEGAFPIGGSEQLIFNNEFIFPIVEGLGLKGVVFFDAGNAFTTFQGIDFGEMRMSVGGGFRWLSPIGPLRIEVGFPLNEHVGDQTQTVMFSFGGAP